MTYNKSSMKKKIKKANSKKTKIKNKLGLSGLQISMIALVVVITIVGSAVLGVAKGIIDSAPDISRIDVVPTGYSTTVYADDGKNRFLHQQWCGNFLVHTVYVCSGTVGRQIHSDGTHQQKQMVCPLGILLHYHITDNLLWLFWPESVYLFPVLKEDRLCLN